MDPVERRRVVRFLFVGGLNTLFGYGLFLAVVQLPIPLWLALAASQIGAVLFNFRTTGGLVFANRDPRLLGRFGAVYGVTYVLNYVGLRALLAGGLSIPGASAALILPMAVVSYLLNRCFVFRQAG